MKYIFTLLILIATLSTASAQHYISVSPKFNESYSDGVYDNIASFKFFLNTSDRYNSGKCHIVFAFDELGDYGVAAHTGWKSEYLEYQDQFTITSSDSMYITVTVSTENLPTLYINIGYNGEKRNIRMKDVDIYYTGSRF